MRPTPRKRSCGLRARRARTIAWTLDPLLVDLFRHRQAGPEALDFTSIRSAAIRTTSPTSWSRRFCRSANKAVGPLIALYEELGEEQGVRHRLPARRTACARSAHSGTVARAAGVRCGRRRLSRWVCMAIRRRGRRSRKCSREIPEEDDGTAARDQARAGTAGCASATVRARSRSTFSTNIRRVELPAFDVLPEAERLELLGSEDAKCARERRIVSSMHELNAKSRSGVVGDAAQVGSRAAVRAEAWESLADVTEDARFATR